MAHIAHRVNSSTVLGAGVAHRIQAAPMLWSLSSYSSPDSMSTAILRITATTSEAWGSLRAAASRDGGRVDLG